MIEPVELRGQFVRLRPLSLADVAPMRTLVSGARDTFTWANVPRPSGVEAYVAKVLSQMERREAVVFATCLPSGEMVGCTRLFDLQRWDWPADADPRPGQDVVDAAEIGYTWIAPAWQRTAMNTEAKLLMLRHAFEIWRCFRVTLKTDERNQRSRRAIERLGAHFDGILRAFQPAVDGKPRNTAYFTILAAEWPDVKARLEAKLRR
ncbi:MAG: GNAT family N-acetyltransferase [Myxococcales bacterium]|nr:GNAT family N-acetyltransferase [Myxococcales bacterium]